MIKPNNKENNNYYQKVLAAHSQTLSQAYHKLTA